MTSALDELRDMLPPAEIAALGGLLGLVRSMEGGGPASTHRTGVPKRLRLRVRCTAKRTSGTPCKAWAVHGARVCRAHGGSAPQVRIAATGRLEDAAFIRSLPPEARHRAAMMLGRSVGRMGGL